MVGRVKVRSCIQMSLMYRSNSYIVHHCWFWARTMAFAFSLFQHHTLTYINSTTITTPLLIQTLPSTPSSFVHRYTERFILNDKRLSYSQWFHAIFSETPIQSFCDFILFLWLLPIWNNWKIYYLYCR